MTELQSRLQDRQVFVRRSQLKWASMFDAFIHIDAENPKWVYTWRLEAEVKLRIEKGSGMTDEQVKRFVDGCKFRKLDAHIFEGRYLTDSRLSSVRAVYRNPSKRHLQG